MRWELELVMLLVMLVGAANVCGRLERCNCSEKCTFQVLF